MSKSVTLILDEKLKKTFERIAEKTGLLKKSEMLRLALTELANKEA